MKYQESNFKSTFINGVKMYSVAANNRSISPWIPNTDEDLTIRVFTVEAARVLDDDYSKLAFLCADRSVCPCKIWKSLQSAYPNDGQRYDM